MRASAFAGLLGVLSSLAARAHSAPLTATIAVESSREASDCPSSEQLTGEVEQILHRTLGSAADRGPALEMSVRFSRTRDGYSALVRSLGPKPGERELRDRGPSCAALAEAASVAIALLLDKELAEPVSAPTPTPDTEPPAPPPAATTESRQASSAASADARSVELRPSFELGASSGLANTPALLGMLGAGVRIERALTVDLLVGAESARETDYERGSVRTSLRLVAVRGCYRWGRAVAVGPCLLFARGWLRGEGVDYIAAQTTELRWLGAGAGVVAEGPVWGRLSWLISGSLWVPLQRSSFSLESGRTAWQSSRLGATASGGLAFALW